MPPERVLLAVATPWEARPLARALGLCAAGPRAWQGAAGGRDVVLLETGMGRARVEAALAGVGDAPVPFALVVSAGLCGALQEGLEAGHLVFDGHGAPLELVQAALPAAERARARLSFGALAEARSVLSPAEKRALAAVQRAAAVDMESAAVRDWAAARGKDFLAVRAVFDALGESAPAEAPEDASLGASLRFAARHWRSLPRLAAAGWRSSRAMDALGRFLAEYLR